jgi:hypothetical protein
MAAYMLLALLWLASAVTVVAGANHGHRTMPGPRPSIVRSPLPHTYIKAEALPASYDIRSMGGRSLATDNRNQHIPQCELSIEWGECVLWIVVE